MAAPRPLNRSFENFGGVDREKSPLTTERIFARLAQNVALVNNTLTMQRGVKPVYTPAIISGAGNISVTHLLGLFQNTYDDSTIRAFQERLLLLYAYIPSNGAFSTSIRVDEITHNGSYLEITNGNASHRYITIYPANSNWTIDIKDASGVSVTGWPQTYGSGKIGLSTNDLVSIEAAIEATTGLSSSVNGNMVNVNTPVCVLPILVAGGKGTDQVAPEDTHGVLIAAGQTVRIHFYDTPSTGVPLEYQLDWVQSTPFFAVDYRHASAINKRNCVYIANDSYYLLKYDGNRFYRAGMPDNNLGIVSSSLGAGALTGTYNYFVDAVRYDNRNNFIQGRASNFHEVAPSAQNPTFIVGTPQAGPLIGTVAAGVTDDEISVTITTGTHKPAVNDLVMIEQSGTNVVVGRIQTVTVTGATTVTLDTTQTVTVIIGDRVWLYNENFALCGAKVNGLHTNQTSITVDSGHTLQAGDTVFFPTGETRVVDATGATSINLTEAITVADNAYISNNVRVRLWRNTNLGPLWYLAKEVPAQFDHAVQSITDSLADADLELEDQFENPIKPIAAPPRCSCITEHQGMTVLGGDRTDNNTFSWEDLEIAESFPLRNAKTIPSITPGGITALGSENNILNVFKDRSHFPVLGDLDAGLDQYGTVTDGDIGIPSHQSLRLARGKLIGCSHKGPVSIQNGVLSTDIGKPLWTDFLEQHYVGVPGVQITPRLATKIVPRLAQAGVDPRNSTYRLFVPAISGIFAEDGGVRDDAEILTSSDYSKEYVYDLEKEIWFDAKRGLDLKPMFGYAALNGIMHTAVGEEDSPISGTDFAFVCAEQDSGTVYDYVDNVDTIEWDLKFAHEGATTPEMNKEFQELMLFCFNLGTFSAFSVRIRGYRNFDEVTPETDYTLTFSSADEIMLSAPLAFSSANVIQIRLTNPTYAQRILLTGFSLRAALTAVEEKMEEL